MTQYSAESEKERIIERNHEIINRKDVQQYISMLSYKRPSGHQFKKEYKEFIDKYLIPYFGEPDRHGNFILINPDYDEDGNQVHPRIAYMAHHDTVHRNVGKQGASIKYNPEAQGDVYVYIKNDKVPMITKTQTVKTGKKDHKGKDIYKTHSYQTVDTQDEFYSNCLGADCTTGVWLIIQMIEAGCPGVYVIHEDEEIGCLGSTGIVNDYQKLSDEEKANHWISHVDIAMSFDRFGEESIITYQSSSRTASDEFAKALSDLTADFFENRGYPVLKEDDGGSYTDSNEYCDLISECTNISVGYYSQHTENERQNIDYLLMLRDCLLLHARDFNNPEKLPAFRDPNEVDTLYGGWGSYGGHYRPNYGSAGYNRRDNSYTFGYDPTDPFGYEEYPDPYTGYYDSDKRYNIDLEENSTQHSHGLSVEEVQQIEYELEDYIQQSVECGDIFNTASEEEIEMISEWLRLFPYIAASLLQNNGIDPKTFVSRMKGEAIRRERLLSYEKLFKKDKEVKQIEYQNEIEDDKVPF